eukprot:252679_1
MTMGLSLTEIVLLCLTSVFLFISWIMALRQLCCISRLDQKPKVRKTILVTMYITLALILNSTMYALAQYPNYIVSDQLDLFTFTYLLEAFLIPFAFHIARILGFTIVEQLYVMVPNVSTPKLLAFCLILAQFVMTLSVIICYTLALVVYVDILYIYICYIIMSVIVFMVAAVFGILLKTLLTILNAVMLTEHNQQKIQASQRAVKGTLLVIVIVCVSSVLRVLSDIERIHSYFTMEWDNSLSNAVGHSVFLIVISVAFMLLVFDYKKECYVVTKQSCWHMYCAKCCKKKIKKFRKNTKPKNPYAEMRQSAQLNEALLRDVERKTTTTAPLNHAYTLTEMF